jgi:hypothetical protein
VPNAFTLGRASASRQKWSDAPCEIHGTVNGHGATVRLITGSSGARSTKIDLVVFR